MKRWFITGFLGLLILAKCAFAQDVTFTASAPEVVELGQQFRLIYTVNAQAKSFNAPTLEGFSVLAGPSTSQSSNVSIINGKVTQNFELRYTYIVQAMKEGEYTIPPAEVTVDNKKYTSNTLKIEVIKGTQGQNQGQQQAVTNQQQELPKEQISQGDLYIKIYVNKTKVHREESIIATVKLFSRLNVTRLENAKLPTLDGFIAQDIEIPPLTSLTRERIGDQVYLTGILKKYLLFPQKSGDIEIDPFEMDVYYQKASNRRQRSIFDDFFGSVESEGRKVISNKVTIHVEDLPANKPYDFSGAVGNLKMTADIDNVNAKTNDPVNLKIKISGSGNIKYINPLKIEFPADFDVYDPKISDNIKYSENGALGNKTFEYLMIPRHAGEFTIPAFNFTYFDTETNQYKTDKAGPFAIKVEKSDGDTSVAVSTAFTKEDIKYIGKDIRFIKNNNIKLRQKGKFIIGSKGFIFLYIISLILFIILFLFRRKIMKENANIVLVKNKKANKYAKKRLKNAYGFMNQNQKEAFYEELVKALWGYLSDKLGIPVANLSKDNARNHMHEKGVDEDTINQILGIIDRCEYARYAPVTEETKMDTLYNDAIKIISKLQQKLK